MACNRLHDLANHQPGPDHPLTASALQRLGPFRWNLLPAADLSDQPTATGPAQTEIPAPVSMTPGFSFGIFFAEDLKPEALPSW
jgi:hypothetical protein